MEPFSNYKEAFFATRVLYPPKHLLATFGSTTLRYVLLSPIQGDTERCRTREGEVTAQRPKILTADFWKKRFEGFDGAQNVASFMEQIYGDAFRSLEYTFKNQLNSTSLESEKLPTVAERAIKSMVDTPRTALIQGPDAFWSVSVMRFILDMSLRSFGPNVQELQDRGLFDPEKREETKLRRNIEDLFLRAVTDETALQSLGGLLKSAGMFGEYEDRFFDLVRSRKQS